MTVSKKIQTIDSKNEKNKAQYDLERHTAKIWTLSSENVGTYQVLTDEDVFLEKDLLENSATIKRFEYSPLVKAFEKQTKVIKKHGKITEKNIYIYILLNTIIGTEKNIVKR